MGSYDISAIAITILFLTIPVLIIGLFITHAIHKKLKEHVLKNSIALNQLALLEKKYTFYEIEEVYTHTKIQRSLASFRKFNYQNELISYVKSDLPFFVELVKRATENKKKFAFYCDEFDYICNTQKPNWNSILKSKIEQKIINDIKLSPVCSVNIKIENVYTSPQGRSQHYDYYLFSQFDVIKSFAKINEQKTFETQKNEERTKMSDSLRYDILKRDNFRCTICGVTAQDGAKLHVDHIRPISRGGKTVKSNLRTLCSSCNLGKGSKYDPNGIN